jgi:hypothetical protein
MECNRDISTATCPHAFLFGISAPTRPTFFRFLFFCKRLHSLLNYRNTADFVRHNLVLIAVLLAKVATTDENTLHREINDPGTFRGSPKRPGGVVV